MKIAIAPRFLEALENRIFQYNDYTPMQPYGVDRPGFSKLKEWLEKRGHSVNTIDKYRIEDIDLCVLVDINYYILYQLLSADNTPKLVYFTREPPSRIPFNAESSLIRHQIIFDKILTWNDDLVQCGDRFDGFNLPYCISDHRYDERQTFGERKLVTNISSRKHSTHPNELYTARKDLIRFYDQSHPESFSLYGRGWNQKPTPTELYRGNLFPEKFDTYCGLVDDKVDIYHQYRFAVSFENITGISGYISEKIFDCLRAGTVPIYWGANNIEEYIPKDIFIDYRDFSGPQDLHNHISSISEEEYKEHLAVAKDFLDSNDRFKPSEFSSEVGTSIISTESKEGEISEKMVERIREQAHLDRMVYDPKDVSRGEFVKRWLAVANSNPKLLVETPQATYFGIRRLLPGSLGEVR